MAENIKIVIVDDNVEFCTGLAAFLKEYDDLSVVAVLNDGNSVVETVEKENADILLLDLVMPVKDGNAAIREIREFDPRAEIVIVSSVGTQAQLKAAIKAGAKDFVQKPLNPKQIHSIISSRFEGR